MKKGVFCGIFYSVTKMFKVISKKTVSVFIALMTFALITGVTLTFLFSAHTNISLLGNEKEEIEVFSEYKDAGFTADANMLFLSFKPETSVEGEVDTNKPGEYKLVYKSSFLGREVLAERTVTVCDKTPPEIKTDAEEFVFEHKGKAPTVKDIKVECSAKDNFDGDLTEKIEKSIEGNDLVLRVTDSSGNKATRKVSIILNDGMQPKLTLKGSSTVYIKAGSTFKEPGYSATDNKDGKLTKKVKVSGKVDTSKNGTYLIEYSVTDDSGNSVKRKRKVVVYGNGTAEDYKNVPANGKTVYLTFDDGPGAYTEKLLGYLDQYNVKATFFVTDQFSGYRDLIGKAHIKGHSIGVHTASHKWSIYKSEKSYMADFERIQKIIEAQTGSRTQIFRFPGGTNNTVSRGQSKGIMTLLSKKLTGQGYVYFDWNVDCNDSRYGSSQEIIESTIKQISSKNNAYVLMHDIKLTTVEAVPAIIEYCLQNGYTFKVLDKDSPPCKFSPQN